MPRTPSGRWLPIPLSPPSGRVRAANPAALTFAASVSWDFGGCEGWPGPEFVVRMLTTAWFVPITSWNARGQAPPLSKRPHRLSLVLGIDRLVVALHQPYLIAP